MASTPRFVKAGTSNQLLSSAPALIESIVLTSKSGAASLSVYASATSASLSPTTMNRLLVSVNPASGPRTAILHLGGCLWPSIWAAVCGLQSGRLSVAFRGGCELFGKWCARSGQPFKSATAMSDLDALLGGPAEEAEERGEGLKPPRRLATSANILAAQKWVSRNMLAQKIKPEGALAMLRTLALLRQELEEVEPEEVGPETWDVAKLAEYRRKQAAGLQKWEEGRNQARAELIEEARAELGEQAAKFLQEKMPVEGKVAPYAGPRPRTTMGRPVPLEEEQKGEEIREALELAEPEEIGPTSTAEAILRDNPGTRSNDGLFEG